MNKNFDNVRALKMSELKTKRKVVFRGLSAHVRKIIIDMPAGTTFTTADVRLKLVAAQWPGLDDHVLGNTIACASRVSPHILRRVNGQKSGMYERLSSGTVTKVAVTPDVLWDQVFSLLTTIRKTAQHKEAKLDLLLEAMKGLD